MSEQKTCPDCLRPFASAEDWEIYAEGEGEHLCWISKNQIAAVGRCGEEPYQPPLPTYNPATHRLVPRDAGRDVVVLDGIVGSLSIVAGGFRTEDGHSVRWRIERYGSRFGWGAQIDGETRNPSTDELLDTFDEAKGECFDYVRGVLGLRSALASAQGNEEGNDGDTC